MIVELKKRTTNNTFTLILDDDKNSTVLSSYTPDPKTAKGYQSEAQLEEDFIERLQRQGFDYLPIHRESDLLNNLRTQLEDLNGYKFTDGEWERFQTEYLIKKNEGIKEKTKKLHEDDRYALSLDNGEIRNFKLIDKEFVHNNSTQVINQYVITEGEGANQTNRYDVTILVNGLPMVHVELKRRGVRIREAFNQIDRYQRDSFWAGSGLFEYVQLFVISNGTSTKYYSNTTRESVVRESKTNKERLMKKGSSFEFTSYWADSHNKTIEDLVDFTKTFFAKHALLNILTKYMVFTVDEQLLVMRPYQIFATEQILNKIQLSYNQKLYGKDNSGGYVWHTTGSGKTLTSFKTAQLAQKFPFIRKVLFVVDRKDLDYQTMREYDRFQEGAANSNTSTNMLQKQLEDPQARVIITTIQKLTQFVKKNKTHPIYKEHVVMVFDECHRSQTGDMHESVIGAFKNHYLFGFTGTPIFPENLPKGSIKTTENIFGDRLHTYTVLHAIRDKNVLRFHVSYSSTIKSIRPDIEDTKVEGIIPESAYIAPKRISLVVKDILEQFDKQTGRNGQFYSLSKVLNVDKVASAKLGKIAAKKGKEQVSGFNSIFAVASIEAAQLYYEEFKRQQESKPEHSRIKVATIYSYQTEEGEENPEDTSHLGSQDRQFLEHAMEDYNQYFGTSYDTSSQKFQNYYKDVSLRMKNREIDLLIVVNMFLTGFDAPTLNTLWVDKNLKYHALMQAFSRTNRILNSTKPYGNIVCYRADLKQDVDLAIALFGDEESGGIVLMPAFEDLVKEYIPLVEELYKEFDLANGKPVILSEQKRFVKLFSSILSHRRIMSMYEEYKPEQFIPDRDFQNYQSHYLDIMDELRPEKADKETIEDDLEFEVELVTCDDINLEYILILVEEYAEGHHMDRELRAKIINLVTASPSLRSKKELILEFIERIQGGIAQASEWNPFIFQKREEELQQIISDENLHDLKTRELLDKAFQVGYLSQNGTDIVELLKSRRRFGGKGKDTQEAKERVLLKLQAFLAKYLGASDKRSFTLPLEEEYPHVFPSPP